MDFTGGLSRTFDPKYAHYYGDGAGRDSYIISNNGGLLCQEGMKVPTTGFNHKTLHSNLLVNQPIHHTSVSPR
jgi:hypothetical protein